MPFVYKQSFFYFNFLILRVLHEKILHRLSVVVFLTAEDVNFLCIISRRIMRKCKSVPWHTICSSRFVCSAHFEPKFISVNGKLYRHATATLNFAEINVRDGDVDGVAIDLAAKSEEEEIWQPSTSTWVDDVIMNENVFYRFPP